MWYPPESRTNKSVSSDAGRFRAVKITQIMKICMKREERQFMLVKSPWKPMVIRKVADYSDCVSVRQVRYLFCDSAIIRESLNHEETFAAREGISV